MTRQMSITTLRLVLGIVVGGYSLALIMTQLRGDAHHVLVLVGVAELVGAILFLNPRTGRAGGIILIVVFGVAALFHVLHGEYSIGYLAVYAAAAFAVISTGTRT